jgi:hypothetical protein
MRRFVPLLASLILSFGLHLIAEQSVVSRCETTTRPLRPEDNQPIPEQLQIPNAPKTARQVSCFKGVKKTSTMLDVVRTCGIPDKHVGSGVYILVYYMNDCSNVTVGTPDLKHIGMRHVKDGKTTVLLNN